jgi:hypothetical protein
MNIWPEFSIFQIRVHAGEWIRHGSVSFLIHYFTKQSIGQERIRVKELAGGQDTGCI